MFRSLFVQHTISALSHLYTSDLPLPYSNTDFYSNITRNLFHNKNSSEEVKIGFIYDFTKNSGYMAVIVTPKKFHIRIKNLIDVENFVKWYSEHYGNMMFKHEIETNNFKTTTYSYNDDYIRYSIVVNESLQDNELDQILIEYKTLN